MNPFCLALIVEGAGDVAALPVLLRRERPEWCIPRPIRVPRGRMVKPDVLRHHAQIAQANIIESGNRGAILVVLDADTDCPAILGPEIRRSITGTIASTIGCVVCLHEFEAWLLAGLDLDLNGRTPESIRDAKRPIKEHFGRYKETADQARLTAKMDLSAVDQQCASFRYFRRQLVAFDAECRP